MAIAAGGVDPEQENAARRSVFFPPAKEAMALPLPTSQSGHEKKGTRGNSQVNLSKGQLSSSLLVFCFILPLSRAVLGYPVWEGELAQKDTLSRVSPRGRRLDGSRVCSAENDTVMGTIASPLLQRHEIMFRYLPHFPQRPACLTYAAFLVL
jgi:hypothetical protein